MIESPPRPALAHPDSTGPGRARPSVDAPAPATGGHGLGYLPGIDGIRAIAVLAVLAYHAQLGWAKGGFLGVEIFFVISGYLITSLLVSEKTSKGRVDFRQFWIRRGRRLLPALWLLLAVTVAFVALLHSGELGDLKPQVFAALTYVSNWYLIVSGASYFQEMGRPSPLAHLWSLAIEEQFYLVWPLVVAGALAVMRRIQLLYVVLAAALGSTVLMWALADPIDPSRAYFGTDTRASGLLIGAALALVWRPSRLRTDTGPGAPYVLDAAGVGALLLLLVWIHTKTDFDMGMYRGGFLVVDVLTAAVIAVAAHPAARLGRVLGCKPLVWVGRRSYGLYLWHWPIFVFTRPDLDLPFGGNPALVLRLGLTFVVAELSFRFVEQPIRRGALGRSMAKARSGGGPEQERARRLWIRGGIAGGVALALLATVLIVSQRPDRDTKGFMVAPAAETTGSTAPATDAKPATPASPASPTTVPAFPAEYVRHDGVALDPSWPKTATVLADSVLLSAQNSIVPRFEDAGWQVDYVGKPAIMLPAMEERIDAMPSVGSVVVVGVGYNSLWERDRAGYDRWAKKFDDEAESLVQALRDKGAKKIVWVTLRTVDEGNVPEGSRGQYEKYNWFFPYVNERLDALAERHPDIALADWAAVSNESELTYDSMHPNTEGSVLMANVIAAATGIR